MDRFVLSVLVENKFGVLARVSGLFSARGFNIYSLAVGETEDPEISRMTIVVDADERILEQIKKQLNKLINVLKVHTLTGTDYVEREMALIKVTAKAQYRAEILRIVDIFRCKVVDVGIDHYTVEVTGNQGKLEAILSLLKPIGIKEIAKTGSIAMFREPK